MLWPCVKFASHIEHSQLISTRQSFGLRTRLYIHVELMYLMYLLFLVDVCFNVHITWWSAKEDGWISFFIFFKLTCFSFHLCSILCFLLNFLLCQNSYNLWFSIIIIFFLIVLPLMCLLCVWWNPVLRKHIMSLFQLCIVTRGWLEDATFPTVGCSRWFPTEI